VATIVASKHFYVILSVVNVPHLFISGIFFASLKQSRETH